MSIPPPPSPQHNTIIPTVPSRPPPPSTPTTSSYRNQLLKQAQSIGNFGSLASYFQQCLDDGALQRLSQSTGIKAEHYQSIDVGYDPIKRAWAFPEQNTEGEVVGITLRLEHPYEQDGRTVNKICIKGSKRGLTMQWPIDAYDGTSLDAPILIVEGQTDTAAGLSLGFTTIGRPTANPGLTIIDSLCSLLQERHAVVIAENDSGIGLDSAKATATILLKRVKSIRVIRPPAEHKDLRLWCVAGLTKQQLLKTIHGTTPHQPDSLGIIGQRLQHQGKPPILVPDTHYDTNGQSHEIGNDQFTDEVLSQLPEGLIYRMEKIVGRVVGDSGEQRFVQLGDYDIRILVDECLRLTRLAQTGRAENRKSSNNFVNCKVDHAKLILAAGATHHAVPEIKMLVNYPTFTQDWRLTHPGYLSGLYFDAPPSLSSLAPIRDHNVIKDMLADLAIDFPFASKADRQNFFGLLLTPLIRWAIQGNAPLHLVMAPLERTGKTKLVEQVFGGLMLGRDGLPAMQLPTNEDEMDKRITAILIHGQTLLNLDNIHTTIDSAPLASLLTSRIYQGRLLGHNKIVTPNNYTTLIGTGNNISASGEIAKRSVPIYLYPATDAPEDRRNFQHPDLPAYIEANRLRIWNCLVGMVLNWIDAGQPDGGMPFGGFESWSRVIGGILTLHDFTAWRTNEREWRRTADPFGEDLAEFLHQWWLAHSGAWMTPKALVELADKHTLFRDLLMGKKPNGKPNALSRRVLKPRINRASDGWIIRHQISGRNASYRLENSPLSPPLVISTANREIGDS